MGTILLPAFMIPFTKWLRASLANRAAHEQLCRHIATEVCRNFLLVALFYTAFVGSAGEEWRAAMRHGDAAVGWFAPLVGCACANVLVFGILAIPIALARPLDEEELLVNKSVGRASVGRSRGRSPAGKRRATKNE